jgi:hypothetical protein
MLLKANLPTQRANFCQRHLFGTIHFLCQGEAFKNLLVRGVLKLLIIKFFIFINIYSRIFFWWKILNMFSPNSDAIRIWERSVLVV